VFGEWPFIWNTFSRLSGGPSIWAYGLIKGPGRLNGEVDCIRFGREWNYCESPPVPLSVGERRRYFNPQSHRRFLIQTPALTQGEGERGNRIAEHPAYISARGEGSERVFRTQGGGALQPAFAVRTEAVGPFPGLSWMLLFGLYTVPLERL